MDIEVRAVNAAFPQPSLDADPARKRAKSVPPPVIRRRLIHEARPGRSNSAASWLPRSFVAGRRGGKT